MKKYLVFFVFVLTVVSKPVFSDEPLDLDYPIYQERCAPWQRTDARREEMERMDRQAKAAPSQKEKRIIEREMDAKNREWQREDRREHDKRWGRG